MNATYNKVITAATALTLGLVMAAAALAGPPYDAGFKARGIRVYLTYYPWETGSGAEAVETVIGLVKWLNVDGVFLDSSKEGSGQLREGRSHPIVCTIA